MNLPIVSDCTLCGHCCEGLGVPPFDYDENDMPFENGIVELPPELLKEIHDQMERDDWQTRDCCWFDPQTRLCRHYYHRPDACDRFTPGNPFCQDILADKGLQHANPREW